MALRIIAYILNGLLLALALLVLLSGNICGTLAAVFAGGFNLYALKVGLDSESGCFNILGLGSNALIFISGAIGVFTGFSLLTGGDGGIGASGLEAGILGIITLGVSLIYISAGIVSAIAIGREP